MSAVPFGEGHVSTTTLPDGAQPGSTTGLAARAACLNIARGIVALGGSVVITRALGPDGRGVFSFVTNAVGVLVLLATAGTPAALTRAKATQGVTPGRLYRSSAQISALSGGLAVVGFVVAYLLLRHGLFSGVRLEQAGAVVALVPLVLLSGFWTVVAYLEGLVLRVGLYSLLSVFGLLMASCVLALMHSLTPGSIIVAWGATSVLPLILLSRRAFRPDLGGATPGLLRSLLRYSARANVASLSLILVWRMDVFMVKGYRGYGELGAYSVAVSIGEILLQVAIALRVALLPQQGRGDDREGLRCSIAKFTRFTLSVGLPAAGLLAASSTFAVRLLYGEEFVAAAPAVALLAPGVVFIVAQGPLIDYLLVEGELLAVTRAAVVALAANVLINVLLLPSHTFLVAAWSSSAAYCITFIMCLTTYCRLTRTRVSETLFVRRNDISAGRGRR